MALTPRTEQVLTTITPAELARTDEVADELGVSRAALLRTALVEYLERREDVRRRFAAAGEVVVDAVGLPLSMNVWPAIASSETATVKGTFTQPE